MMNAVLSDHPSSSVEILSFVMFLEELRRAARFVTPSSAADPLDAALQAIRRNPALPQSRLLGRILEAYNGHGTSFRRAETAAFDKEHLALLAALMNAHDTDSYDQPARAAAAEAAMLALREIDC
jgi:hypothetical protein